MAFKNLQEQYAAVSDLIESSRADGILDQDAVAAIFDQEVEDCGARRWTDGSDGRWPSGPGCNLPAGHPEPFTHSFTWTDPR